MTEEIKQLPIEDRLVAVETQGYISYLMINSLIKVLTEREIVDKDLLSKEMDELNERLYNLTKDLIEQEAKEEVPPTE